MKHTIITHNLASQKRSLRSRRRCHRTISPLLEFCLWAQWLSAESLPSGNWSHFAQMCRGADMAGRLHEKEYTVLWDVTCIPEFPCKRRLKLLSVVLRAHPYLAFSLFPPCFPYSWTGFTWKHCHHKSLAHGASSQGLLLGYPPTVLLLML